MRPRWRYRRCREAAERNARQDAPPPLFGERGMSHRRIDDRRRYGIDDDAARAELAREPHGQRHDRRFGRAIERIADRAAAAHGRNRCDIDDPARPCGAIAGTAARTQWTIPSTLTRATRSNSPAGKSATAPSDNSPAALTRMEGAPILPMRRTLFQRHCRRRHRRRWGERGVRHARSRRRRARRRPGRDRRPRRCSLPLPARRRWLRRSRRHRR